MAKSLACVASITENTSSAQQRILLTLWNTPVSPKEIDLANVIEDSRPDPDFRFPDVKPDCEAVGFFTSGSTGLPKLIVYSHEAIMVWSFGYYGCPSISEDAVMFLDRPMIWAGGYPLIYLGGGSTMIYLMSPLGSEKSDEKFVNIITEEKPDIAIFVEHRVNSLRKRPDLLARLQRLPKAVSVGQAVTKKTIEARLRFCDEVRVMYGITDYNCCFSFRAKRACEVETGIIGRPAQGFEVKLANEKNDIVDVGEEGELCLRGSMSSKYYLSHDGRKIANTDNEGWFHTGDIGVCGPDGLFVLKGRKVEIIKRATVKIFPAFVENNIRDNLEIAEVVVVGIPHKILYEDVCACIVILPGKPLTVEDIKQRCEDVFQPSLAPDGLGYMPGQFLLLDKFPRLTSGKHDRKLLKKIATEAFCAI